MSALLLILFQQLPAGTIAPTWHGDIREILAGHCMACHYEEGSGPFSLQTIENVRSRATFIETVIKQGIMPPWLPSSKATPLENHRGLSQQEQELFSRWIKAGMPAGSPDEFRMQSPPRLQMDPPDIELKMPAPWPIPAEGSQNWGRVTRDKRSFVLPLNNNRTLRIRSIRHRSHVPKAVHAVTFLADTTGSGRYLDDQDNGPGYYMAGDVRDTPSGDLGGVGVGARHLVLPDGYHWSIKPESDLLMQINFRPTGRIEFLDEEIHLWETDRSDSRPLRTLSTMVRRVDVPAGKSVTIQDSRKLPVDVDLVGFTPRANGIVTRLDLKARLPDGEERVLLHIPEHDPHWIQTWLLENPMRLPAGTILSGSWTLANTEENPRNPFLPLDRYVAARRSGVLSILLHAAARDPDQDAVLLEWQRKQTAIPMKPMDSR